MRSTLNLCIVVGSVIAILGAAVAVDAGVTVGPARTGEDRVEHRLWELRDGMETFRSALNGLAQAATKRPEELDAKQWRLAYRGGLDTNRVTYRFLELHSDRRATKEVYREANWTGRPSVLDLFRTESGSVIEVRPLSRRERRFWVTGEHEVVRAVAKSECEAINRALVWYVARRNGGLRTKTEFFQRVLVKSINVRKAERVTYTDRPFRKSGTYTKVAVEVVPFTHRWVTVSGK